MGYLNTAQVNFHFLTFSFE